MLRVGLAQINPTVGDIKGNTLKVIRWLEKARKQDVDVVAFPELAICGYPAEDLLLRRRFLDDCEAAIERIAGKVGRMVAVIGYPRIQGKALHNSAAVIHNKKLVSACSKIHLPNYGVFDEKRYFTPGRNTCVLSLGRARIGISICEDIWHKDVVAAQVKRAGAGLVLNISSSPYQMGKGSEREALMIERAVENDAHVAYLNLVGGQDELVFDGHSMIIDPAGGVIARARQFEEDLIVADLDEKTLRKPIQRMTASGRGGKSRSVPVRTLRVAASPRARKRRVAPRLAEPVGRLEEAYRAILLGTRDYVRKNGFRKVVIGLSGGIDSALVAAVAADALGEQNVVGVGMPSRYSSRSSVTDARKLARNLGIEFKKIGIDRVFRAYRETMGSDFKRLTHDVAEENIQARIRGNILMALSNKYGWLVLTTGNKSELAVGYCTLYGDLAGGFAILKDVPKTLVYELAAYRNSLGKTVIPASIMTKPPSAELRPDQKDEDTLPPYEILDPVLDMYVLGDLGIDAIASKGYARGVVRRVAGLVDGNEYKRRQGPPGIKITTRAFGKDRRMPITNRYR
ncbi:MAG: NAD+ synthase [bacterium]|jgi:NAD+ synthase (glutamine-hydrolysing)